MSETHYTTRQAASRLGVSHRTLEHWRLTGGGPPYLKLGGAVRYRDRDIQAWEDSRLRESTTEAPVASALVTAWER